MFEIFHKKNNYKKYKSKINRFAFPKEILKDQSELDHIYELIPKYWTYGKLMSTLEDLDIDCDDLTGTRLLDDVDFDHIDKEVIVKMLEYNGLLLGYLIKKWPDLVDEELSIAAVKQNEKVLSFVDNDAPFYEKLLEAIDEAHVEEQKQDEWIEKEHKKDVEKYGEIDEAAKKEMEKPEEKWGDL